MTTSHGAKNPMRKKFVYMEPATAAMRYCLISAALNFRDGGDE